MARVTAGGDHDEPLDVVLRNVSRDFLARNGVPDPATAARREHGRRLAEDELGPLLAEAGLRCSPLGVGWTDVAEAVLRAPVDSDALRRRGWLRIGHLLPAINGRTGDAWLVVDDGRPLITVRLHRAQPAPTPGTATVERCRSTGEVTLRDVLELAAMRREGAALPTASTVLRVAADIESGLGGRELAPWASGQNRSAPAQLPRTPAHRRRQRTVVALSGVDGSGKTTLRSALVTDLQRAGVPVSTVWVRPGMGLGGLVRIAAAGKRALRQDASPGLRAMADRPDGGAIPRSRRGLVGWVWSMLVTMSFLANVHGQHRRATGSVVVYDRHLLDALATLDFAYEGVDLRVQHALVRSLLPRAHVRFYLDVPAEVSVDRKPDDLLGAAAVRRQLSAYARWLSVTEPAQHLDATLPAQELSADALRLLTDLSDGRRPPGGRLRRRRWR